MSNQYHLINFAKIQFKSIEMFNTYEKKMAFQIQFHSSEKVDWNIRWKHSCIFKQSICKKNHSNHIQKKKKKNKYAEFDGSFSAFCLKWNEIDDERISIQNEILWWFEIHSIFMSLCSLDFWQIAHFTVDKSMTVNILRHSLVEENNVGQNVSIVVTMLKSGVRSDWQMESYQ